MLFERYDDSRCEEALDRGPELELQTLGSNDDEEIVILEASTEAHVRRTHRRYFETLEGIVRSFVP